MQLRLAAKTTSAPARFLQSPQTTTSIILPHPAIKSSDRGDKFRKIKKSGEYRMILRYSPDLPIGLSSLGVLPYTREGALVKEFLGVDIESDVAVDEVKEHLQFGVFQQDHVVRLN